MDEINVTIEFTANASGIRIKGTRKYHNGETRLGKCYTAAQAEQLRYPRTVVAKDVESILLSLINDDE